MFHITSDNFQKIKEMIYEIVNNKLREVIVDYFNDDDYYNIKNYDNLCDFLQDEIVEELFNSETYARDVLEYHGYYHMILDTSTFIKISQYIQESLYDMNGDNEIFGSLFTNKVAHQTEIKVINMFCYLFCKEEINSEPDVFEMYDILRNIIITQNNQKKNNKLIHLFNRYNNLHKQKPIIQKIFKNKFHIDIIQNIISVY